MRKGFDTEHHGAAEHRIGEARKGLLKLYLSNGEIVHLASGSGGDVFISGDGDNRVVYKVRRIDAQVRPDYLLKEALTAHLLATNGMAPKLVGYLPDTTKGINQARQKRLDLDVQNVQVLKSHLDEEILGSFQALLETRTDITPVDTGVIRMQYVENDRFAYRRFVEAYPEEISRQLQEIARFLRKHELYPSDIELVFDAVDNRLKFRDVGGFRVCGLKEGDWEEAEDAGGVLEDRLRELLVSLERMPI